MNLISYVGQNPVNWVDPLGLKNWGNAFGQALEGPIGNALGYAADAVGMAFDASGTWSYYGSAALGAAGAVAGNLIVPGAGAVVGGIVGGAVGGILGGFLDISCAGQLNCNERIPPQAPPQPAKCH